MISFPTVKHSAERYKPGWQTTRFWISSGALATNAMGVAWGAQHEVVGPIVAGCFGSAIIAAVYVWAISREP